MRDDLLHVVSRGVEVRLFEDRPVDIPVVEFAHQKLDGIAATLHDRISLGRILECHRAGIPLPPVAARVTTLARGVIINGKHRLCVARRLGLETIPVVHWGRDPSSPPLLSPHWAHDDGEILPAGYQRLSDEVITRVKVRAFLPGGWDT